MNSKSTVRLRLECLETRTVLSATALPLVPPAAPPPPPAMLGEFHTIGGHSPAQAAITDAMQNAAVMLGANSASTPVHPGNASYGQPPAGEHFSGPTPGLDYHDNSGLWDESPVFHSSTLAAPDLTRVTLDLMPVAPDLTLVAFDVRLVAPARPDDFRSTPLIHNLPDASQVFNVDHGNVQVGDAATSGLVDAGDPASNPAMPPDDSPLSPGMAGGWSGSDTFGNRAPGQNKVAENFALDAPLPFSAAFLSRDMSEGEPVMETIFPFYREPPVSPAPINHPADPPVPFTVGNDVSLGIEMAAPVKARLPDSLAVSDPSRVGDLTLAAVATSLPASSVNANPLTTLAPSSDSATSSTGEGGFISLDDATVIAPQLGNPTSNSLGSNGVDGTDLNYGNWLPDIRPDLRKPAGSNNLYNAAGSTKIIAADVFSRAAPVVLRPVADSEEGGSIELAMAPPTTTGDLPPAGDPTAANNAQQLSEIRPESGVRLFCDIEVADDPGLPIAASAAAISHPNSGSLAVGAGVPTAAAHGTTEFAPPLTKLSRPTLAGLAENLPLLVGVTVLVSRGGLRLEEEVPQRERYFRSCDGLRRS